MAEGKGNRVKNDGKSSSRDIIVRNVFTYFNLLYLVIFAVLAALGSYRNLLFIFVAVGNTGLGIYQQLKAKKVLDQMRILTDAKVETLREGKLVELSRDDLVLGDWIRLTRGDQIPADGVLREGYIETDESMLTGEFDPVKKETGSPLYSGSSVTSGTGYAELTCVGEEIYARKIMAEGKAEKRIVGTVQKSLTKILKIISALAVPFALLYLLKHAVLQGEEIRGVLLEVTGAMLGLIPAGLMLLTSVALSVSSMRLAQKGILFEEPYAVESIAKADLICLDKTGTLTEGKLRVEKVVPYAERDFEKILGNMMRAMKEESGTTAEAMRNHFEERSEFHFKELIPFSSDKKYSGVIFEEGTWYMGAAEYLLEKPDPKRYAEVLKISLNGNRVLAIVEEKDGQRNWIGSVILSDTIRTSLRGTLENLRAQGVSFAVLSGDNADTVSYIASKAGIPGAMNRCDMSKERERGYGNLVNEYTVFGRVTPADKASLIKEWKKAGKTVAMFGDGINDLPALRASDCGIAMIDGAKATRQAADAVLMKNDFAVILDAVTEGKRVINNITVSASLYLIKTMWSFLFLAGMLVLPLRYPFEPVQLSFISGFFVGFPTFVLASFGKNTLERIEPFMPSVIKRTLPGALAVTLTLLVIPVVGRNLGMDEKMITSALYLLTAWNYLCVLLDAFKPLSLFKGVLLGGITGCFLAATVIFRSLLNVSLMFTVKPFSILLAVSAVILFVLQKVIQTVTGYVLVKRKYL